jgi:transposase
VESPQIPYFHTSSPGASFNVSWLIDGNLVPLFDKFFPIGWNSGHRKLIVHIDNAPVHNSRMIQDFFRQNPLKRLQQPPYSPDMSASGSYLFGKVKITLIGREILDEMDLLEAITEILNDISGTNLQFVF